MLGIMKKNNNIYVDVMMMLVMIVIKIKHLAVSNNRYLNYIHSIRVPAVLKSFMACLTSSSLSPTIQLES